MHCVRELWRDTKSVISHIAPTLFSACLAAVLTASVSAGDRREPCQYDVTIIEAPFTCGSFPVSIPIQAINNTGVVYGGWNCPPGSFTEPYRWTAKSGFEVLEDIPMAFDTTFEDVNDAGLAVGWAMISGDPYSQHGFAYDGEAFTLIDGPKWANYTQAYAISTSGVIVGRYGNTSTGPVHAMKFEADTLVDLHPIDEEGTSCAEDVNVHGQVVGWVGCVVLSCGGGGTAVIWDGDEMTDLGVIPGGVTSEGRAINDHGDVLGQGWIEGPSGNERHGFVWIDGQFRMIAPSPGKRVSMSALNNRREALGVYQDGGGGDFLWRRGETWLIDELVTEADYGFENIGNAFQINDRGQIGATAVVPGPGTPTRAIILTPKPGSFADLTGDCATGSDDLFALLAAWGERESAADLNYDGVVDAGDLAWLLADWSG